MSTHVPGFQTFFRFLHHFVLAKLATSSIRVNTPHWSTTGHLDAIGIQNGSIKYNAAELLI